MLTREGETLLPVCASPSTVSPDLGQFQAGHYRKC